MKGITMANHRRRTALAAMLAATLALGACGGGDDGGGTDVSARPAQEQVTFSSAEELAPFELQAGRYKFGWDASECGSVNFVLTGTGQGFVWEKKTLQKKFSSIVSDVPEDVYTLTQNDPACTTWTVQIDRLGG